ncbi:MAG: hypothetical protein BWY04_00481 [candidate division CPR1 bacterium ADurb.Bin160]|uniref:Nudix hydrolase domain-containing protein n=1 Tax=candidate division CPR1 bacterium ADurb.Bin160 TaxID=1852826 RepID=A0A1V5ZP33_9BACT|nr:MAG: hypothetical protein BWY04_00481 [candidate division CPR1 bacterium ADurb.Bin160]
MTTIMSDLNNIKKRINVSGAIIYRKNEYGENEILLIQRSKDDHFPLMWEIPRGKCDRIKNENIRICLRREVNEECGLDIKIEKFINSFFYLADGGERQSKQYNFLCRVINPEQPVILSEEHSSFQWISEVSKIQLMVMPEIYKTIKNSEILNFSDKKEDVAEMIEEGIKEFFRKRNDFFLNHNYFLK